MLRSGWALLRGSSSAVRNATTAAAKKASPASETKAPGANPNNISRRYAVSKELSEFMGAEEVTRQEVTSKVWDYIRTHKLQNPDKKTEYIPDARLKKILDADVITFSSIPKLLSEHFPKPTTTSAPRAKREPKAKKAAE